MKYIKQKGRLQQKHKKQVEANTRNYEVQKNTKTKLSTNQRNTEE